MNIILETKKELYKIFNGKINIQVYFFLLCWFFLWISINGKPSQLGSEGINILNGIRSIIPMFLLIFSLFFIFREIFKNNIKEKYKNIDYLILVFFFIYLLCQLIGGLLYDGKYDYLETNYLLYSQLLSIFCIFIFFNSYKKLPVVFISLISIFFVFALSIFYLTDSLSEYFFNPNFILSKWMYAIHPITNEFFDNPFPRITGMSRMIALSTLALTIYLLSVKNKIIFFTLFSIIILSNSVIWGMQSRGSIICLIASLFVLVLFNYKYSIIKRFLYFFLLIGIPFFLYENISNIKIKNNIISFKENCLSNGNIDKDKELKRICKSDQNSFYRISVQVAKTFGMDISEIKTKKFLDIKNEEFNKDKIDKINEVIPENQIRFLTPSSNPNLDYSSGRIHIWKRILKNYDYNKVFGYGPQGDRKLLIKDHYMLSTNASNLYLYVFASSGYIGALFFIIANFLIGIKLLSYYFKNNLLYENYNYPYLLASTFIIFFFIRSFIENTFSVFSIDSLLFLNSLLILMFYKKKSD
tara:strand:- start:197 stop:1777 length:1581 start_codon:yes stop_codon:yes gene_type:complete